MKRIVVPFLSAALGGILAFAGFKTFEEPQQVITERVVVEQNNALPVAFGPNGNPQPDLTAPAATSLDAVVHVHTVYSGQEYYGSSPLFDLFYGRPQYRQAPEGTGSGVIISNDGYIVTNNHVVESAQKVKITLHNKDVYDAKIIGTDPSTDLALLKIEATELPYLRYGDSDELKVGEWVLAVGNPFNLNSTVTAGIVSATGRDINILATDRESGISPVEAFIQTDAAVNPGNSGGALVNVNGELIGINAAIKSNTGSFAGYSFAIPSNITQKVVRDLIEFGAVQRAFIGVSIRNINEQIAKENDLKTKDGIYVAGLANKGSALEAGMEVGDVITKVNGKEVNNVPELQEQISKYRPGDKVTLSFLRNNEVLTKDIVLRNQYGNTEIIENNPEDVAQLLGAKITPINDKQKDRLGIRNGLQITDLSSGKLMKAGIRENFIVVKVDGKRVNSPNDLATALSGKKGGILFEGIYPNGRIAYYGVGL